MTFVLFTHSIRSDWNHGNAHFLRGMCAELISRGHQVRIYEPEAGWSAENLAYERGREALADYRMAYPMLDARLYRLDSLEVSEALDGADVVLVHEWNEPELVSRIGEHRRSRGGYRLFFHDTHHRSVTAPDEMARYDLSGYDGVLAFGEVIRQRYLEFGWTKAAWTWHEAADPRVFRPRGPRSAESPDETSPRADSEHPTLKGDLVWIGNWGDDERAAELREFLLSPVKELGLRATVYGVRYPDHALKALADAGIDYGGSLANYKAPEAFARYRMTVHVPRRPYVDALPGIPTIRVFEALACGIPLISAPWRDSERLFRPGDFLFACDGADMKRKVRYVLDNPDCALEIARQGLDTVLARHTVRHRVDELLGLPLFQAAHL